MANVLAHVRRETSNPDTGAAVWLNRSHAWLRAALFQREHAACCLLAQIAVRSWSTGQSLMGLLGPKTYSQMKNLNESPGNRKGLPDNPTKSEDLEEGCPNGPGRPAGHRGGVQVWRESGSFRAAGSAEGAAHMLHSRPLCGARGCSDAEVGPPSVPMLSFVSLRLFGGVFGVGRQLGVE